MTRIQITFLSLCFGLATAPSCAAQNDDRSPFQARQTDVITYHYDISRSGQNLREDHLTPENVNSSTFGKLFTVATDGKVDGQPLYVSNLVVQSRFHDVVYAVTEHDSVYAFDQYLTEFPTQDAAVTAAATMAMRRRWMRTWGIGAVISQIGPAA